MPCLVDQSPAVHTLLADRPVGINERLHVLVDRVTEKEDEWNIGYDEKDKLVAVSEEFLVDRIERFKKYRQTLMKRQDEYEDKLEVCDAEVKAKKEKTASDSSDE